MTNENPVANGEPIEAGYDPMRRMVLGALAGTVGLIAAAQTGRAQDDAETGGEEPIFNAYERKRTFDRDEMDGAPWVAAQTGEFDLADPAQNRLARLKMTNNLVGRRTYIPMLVRMVIGREPNPGGPLLGAASMFTWQLQVPNPEEFPDAPDGTALMRSMFTARYLDPETMEPVERLLNPFSGEMMEVEDYIFVENFLTFPNGGSRFVEERQFADDDPSKPKLSLFKKWGDELVLFAGGVYSKPGPHQPRFTENMWGSAHADVMNPDVELIETRYSFMGVNKAYEKPWAGYRVGDADILCSLAHGKKVHSAEDLPDFHKRVLAEKYPDRL